MKKNIVIFYPSFEKGGVTNILRNLVKDKKSKNYNIYLISSKNLIYSNNKKKNYFFLPIKNKTIPLIPQRFTSSLIAVFTLISLLNRLKSKTMVHSMQSNVAAIIACLLKNKKIVIRNSENPLYSTFYSENKFFGFLVFILKLIFYNFADGIITNSQGSANDLKNFVFNKKKIFHIYNPYIKKINYKIYKKQNYIINIGRLRKQKDHKTLLSAFYLFSKVNSNYKLLILGHGNLKSELLLLSKKLGIKKKVIFKGWVKNTKLYLKKSKIFVLSSVYEGLGNVLLDAINYNVPCISTNCPSGPNEILLNGRGGYLVKVKSPELLAKKMLMSVKRYNHSLKLNNEAKKKLNRFLISKNTEKYFNYLENFL